MSIVRGDALLILCSGTNGGKVFGHRLMIVRQTDKYAVNHFYRVVWTGFT